MTLNAAILNQLLATSAVTALLGDRIYHLVAAEREPTPYAVFFLVDDPQEHTCGNDAGPYASLYQVSVYGKTSYEAGSAADAIVTALRDYSGVLGGAGGVTVERIEYEGKGDAYDDPAGLPGVILEFEIKYQAQ